MRSGDTFGISMWVLMPNFTQGNNMKKIVIALMLALGAFAVTFPASATGNFGGIQYEHFNGRDNKDGPNQNGFAMTLGTGLTKSTDVDLTSRFARANATGTTANMLEGGVTQSYAAGPASVYLRSAIGQLWTATNDHTYYSVEPGVKVAVGNTVSLKAGYRFRDVFAKNDLFQTNTLRLGAEYEVSKDGAITIGLDRSYKDEKLDSIAAGYAFKF